MTTNQFIFVNDFALYRYIGKDINVLKLYSFFTFIISLTRINNECITAQTANFKGGDY